MKRCEGEEWCTIQVDGGGQWAEQDASHHVTIFPAL